MGNELAAANAAYNRKRAELLPEIVEPEQVPGVLYAIFLAGWHEKGDYESRGGHSEPQEECGICNA